MRIPSFLRQRPRPEPAPPPPFIFQSGQDLLTEALSRARFKQNLDDAVRFGTPIAVHIVDIDDFRAINEALGRSAGDDILREVARRLRSICDRDHLLARLSNDEFGIAEILKHPRQVTRTSRRILQALNEPIPHGDSEAEISACIGSAVAPTHGDDGTKILKSADIALRDAKAQGYGSRSLFRPGMAEALGTRSALGAHLRNAVETESFELAFQPIRDAASRRLAGFEALLRLPRPGGGDYVSPMHFIPVAEQLGLIGAIGDWVIARACALAAEWPGKLHVSVNLSPVQFEDGGLVESVRSALQESRLKPARLQLEITEGLLLSHREAAEEQLRALKALGVTIVMDDFGSGYSSLGYLLKLPVDGLKIDPALSREASEAGVHAAAIRAIAALGKALGMRVTAKGVETAAQEDRLVGDGCDELQGFHCGRPMPLSGVPGFILQDFRAAMPDDPGTPGLKPALKPATKRRRKAAEA